MQRSFILACGFVGCIGVAAISAGSGDGDQHRGRSADFGAWVQEALRANAEQLFGFTHPLRESALGPFDGSSTQALVVAKGLKVSLVSSAVHFSADQIALWPDDDHPTHLFVCDEESSNPAVQRVDLSRPNANATTIVTGIVACDPVRRTPWGTIIVAEEAGLTGGFYEIFNPAAITTAINVTDRGTGANTDSTHLAKQKAIGSLSFESFAIREDGTMIYGDELAPSGGNAGGGIYKFVPDMPYSGGGVITSPGQSPFASGKIYGLRVAAAGSSNWGQGAETGKGAWVAVNTAPTGVVDANGNILLRNAQLLQKFTGYYRPEDMDIDPLAAEQDVFRACWANTGRMSHSTGSLVENSDVASEVMCLTEEPPSTAVPSPVTGTIPSVQRFVPGDRAGQMYDNVAFQPHTGNLAIAEDGPTSLVTETGTELRGNDIWICLPDGDDKDNQTDGCVRMASLKDTTSEPTGIIFTGSGETMYLSLQHRGVDEAGGTGSLVKITGFKVNCEHDHRR